MNSRGFGDTDKTQKMKIIVDTSSWINVFRVDLTNYLIENFYIFMTPKIEEEILEGGVCKGCGIIRKTFG